MSGIHRIIIDDNEQSDASITIQPNTTGSNGGKVTDFLGLHIDYEDASGVMSREDLIRIRDGINDYLAEHGSKEAVSAPISNEPELELRFA